MAVVRLLVGFRANDEGCRSDKLTLEMLSRSATCVRGISVFANKTLGIRVVHCFHEGAFGFQRHGGFTNSKGVVDAAKEPGQMYVANFVGLDAKVGVVLAEHVPDVKMRIVISPSARKPFACTRSSGSDRRESMGMIWPSLLMPEYFPFDFCTASRRPSNFCWNHQDASCADCNAPGSSMGVSNSGVWPECSLVAGNSTEIAALPSAVAWAI